MSQQSHGGGGGGVVGQQQHNAPTTSNVDAAQEAAALAEWSAKTRVWVPNAQEGFLPGWILSSSGSMSLVAYISSNGGETQTTELATSELERINPPNFDAAEDIASLTYLNEASVVHNLRTRYHAGQIYTYSGLFLVAVNPYRSLPLYSPAVVAQYKRSRRDAHPPHVFSVAETAWQKMTAHGESQSILVTGESGAGKTETTKKVIQYLAAIAADPTSLPASTSFDRLAQAESLTSSTPPELGQLERKIIEANPILEAFGNAQTMRNDNSSRFGKFVRIFFNAPGAIVGANIDWYLLEKSRVTARTTGERNYHVFYQMLRGADAGLKRQLLLDGRPSDYEYLKHSADTVPGVDDRLEWTLLQRALSTVGFTSAEQLDLFKVLSSILHLGNITLGGSEQAHLVDRSQVERVAFLLGVDDAALAQALTRPKVKAGREWVQQARTPAQVREELAALSKSLYEKMFGAIVERVNRALGRPSTRTFIGVLDIAGFEIFETNGFEQLLINLTNEKLQQFFNHQAFVLEQEEYAREQISWDFVNFGLELQPTIDLIESNNPMGILSCLDDETFMPKGSDKQLTEKLDSLAKSNGGVASYSKYTPSRLEQGFTVKHYAGSVEYRTDGWLATNKDPLSDNLSALLSKSTDSYVAKLFGDYVDPEAVMEGPRTRVRRGAFRTVGQRHKEQLALLMKQLNETQPHFIRCIVPNAVKSPKLIDVPLVLTQLRCNGVIEGIRIARIGFPNRLPFAEFRRKFAILAPSLPSASKSTFIEGNEACAAILKAIDLNPQSYRLGLTKVFFKADILAELEKRRDDRLADIVTRVQATCRKFVGLRRARRTLHRAAAVEMIQRNARIYLQLRQWPWWKLYQQVRPLLAAARSDDEMRRKEEELAAIKAQAEKEHAEREKLEKAQIELEQERVRIEAALEQERLAGEEKDEALERGREKVLQLEEQLAAAETDVETVERHLERAMSVKKDLEQRIAHLDSAFANQARLLQALQAEQTAWKAREAELASQTSVKAAEWEQVISERDQGRQALDELKRRLSDEGQDRRREEKRLVETVASLEARLAVATKDSTEAARQLIALETEKRRAAEEKSTLLRQKDDLDALVESKSAELRRLSSDNVALVRARDASTAQTRDLETRLAALTQDLTDTRRNLDTNEVSLSKAAGDLLVMKKLLDTQSGEHERTTELNKLREAEVRDLKQQLTQITAELDLTHRDSTSTINRLRQELDASKRDATDFQRKNVALEQRASASAARVIVLDARVEDLERSQQAHDLELELVRNEVAEAMLKERAGWERQVAELRSQVQTTEDAAVEARREKDAAKREIKALHASLAAERANFAAEQEARRAAEEKNEQQHAVLADYDRLNGDLRHELNSTKARLDVAEEKAGRTVVEHVRAHAEALRLQSIEMDRVRAEKVTLEARKQSLERAMTRAAEDAQHEREALARQAWASGSSKPSKDATTERALEDLAREQKLRELAELNVHRLRNEVQLIQNQYGSAAAEIKELKRQNAAFERELSSVAASDHTEAILPRANLRDSRLINSMPLSSYPNRVSLPVAAKPSATPGSPRRRNYE